VCSSPPSSAWARFRAFLALWGTFIWPIAPIISPTSLLSPIDRHRWRNGLPETRIRAVAWRDCATAATRGSTGRFWRIWTLPCSQTNWKGQFTVFPNIHCAAGPFDERWRLFLRAIRIPCNYLPSQSLQTHKWGHGIRPLFYVHYREWYDCASALEAMLQIARRGGKQVFLLICGLVESSWFPFDWPEAAIFLRKHSAIGCMIPTTMGMALTNFRSRHGTSLIAPTSWSSIGSCRRSTAPGNTQS